MSAPVNASPRGRYVEVCAGAGGFGLGLHDAGWTGTGIELNSDAAETHRRHVGPCLTADVTTIGAPHPADFACGGVPCQPFSSAGKGLALDDPRGRLFESLLRFADETGARACVMENVRGLVSKGVLPHIARAFEARGFKVTHRILNAADFGVPQVRHRLFVAGFRREEDFARFRWPEPTHDRGGLILPRWRTVREALELGAGDFVQIRDSGPNSPQAKVPPRTVDAPAYCLTAAASGRAPGGITLSLLDRPSPTIGADGADTGGAEPLANAATRRRLVSALGRRLTPEDCAILQDFPRGMTFCGAKGSQHRQIGNAVPRRLGAAVARSVWAALYGGATHV